MIKSKYDNEMKETDKYCVLFKASKQLNGMLGSGDAAAAAPFPQSELLEEPPASEKKFKNLSNSIPFHLTLTFCNFKDRG